MTTQPRRWITCACCGKQGRHEAHGWRRACYRRWADADKPATGPPPPKRGAPGVPKSRETIAARIEDFLFLREIRHLDRTAAARELGVNPQTIRRYERRLQQQETA